MRMSVWKEQISVSRSVTTLLDHTLVVACLATG